MDVDNFDKESKRTSLALPTIDSLAIEGGDHELESLGAALWSRWESMPTK